MFRGRKDLFAIRWEKDGRSGYIPTYKVDWSRYQKHKAQGGTFNDYPGKTHYHLMARLFKILYPVRKHAAFIHCWRIIPLLTHRLSLHYIILTFLKAAVTAERYNSNTNHKGYKRVNFISIFDHKLMKCSALNDSFSCYPSYFPEQHCFIPRKVV